MSPSAATLTARGPEWGHRRIYWGNWAQWMIKTLCTLWILWKVGVNTTPQTQTPSKHTEGVKEWCIRNFENTEPSTKNSVMTLPKVFCSQKPPTAQMTSIPHKNGLGSTFPRKEQALPRHRMLSLSAGCVPPAYCREALLMVKMTSQL